MVGTGFERPNGTNLFIYFSHLLSAWGNRMWSFGVGLFLVIISPGSLQLTAVYGLFTGVSSVLFGSLVGYIVDRSSRLKAAQVSLVLSNMFVVMCAVVIYLFLVYRAEITSQGIWATHLVYGLIILTSVLSTLASMARKITVENDWIVQICGSNSDKLATMTSTLRRIDLATQILAPIATGFIMGFIGSQFGALFIASWNVLSVVVEYYLLWKVYSTIPSLRKMKGFQKLQNESEDEDFESDEELLTTDEPEGVHADNEEEALTIDEPADVELEDEEERLITDFDVEEKSEGACLPCCKNLSFVEGLYKGWPVYMKYSILPAGVSLSCLYMTVLGFDSITIGYIKLQGISEAVVGVSMGISAAVGIIGTLVYPLMKKRIGLIRTGIIGLSAQLTALSFCVASVWVPGSPFDLSLGMGPAPSDSQDSVFRNCTNVGTAAVTNNTSQIALHRVGTNQTITTADDPLCQDILESKGSYISIGLFLIGITLCRFGLWLADLSISQIYFETVIECERGKVGGVQTALNQTMDMLKFGLVIILPYQHQFGLLVLISYAFISLGWLLYSIFLYRSRGHLIHFKKYLVEPLRNIYSHKNSQYLHDCY